MPLYCSQKQAKNTTYCNQNMLKIQLIALEKIENCEHFAPSIPFDTSTNSVIGTLDTEPFEL